MKGKKIAEFSCTYGVSDKYFENRREKRTKDLKWFISGNFVNGIYLVFDGAKKNKTHEYLFIHAHLSNLLIWYDCVCALRKRITN